MKGKKLTNEGIGRGAVAPNTVFFGSDWDLNHTSLYQFRGSRFVAVTEAGSLDLDKRVKGLLPRILKSSSSTAVFQVSTVWNKCIRSGFIHWTGTLTNRFSRAGPSLSVSSPLMPSTPTASIASLTVVQTGRSLCTFSSAIACRWLTFYTGNEWFSAPLSWGNSPISSWLVFAHVWQWLQPWTGWWTPSWWPWFP